MTNRVALIGAGAMGGPLAHGCCKRVMLWRCLILMPQRWPLWWPKGKSLAIQPQRQQRRLAGDAAAQGLHWVDSPLSGGAPKAIAGELTLMAGRTLKAVSAAHCVLQHVSGNYSVSRLT